VIAISGAANRAAPGRCRADHCAIVQPDGAPEMIDHMPALIRLRNGEKV
jgi:hypothetical protein